MLLTSSSSFYHVQITGCSHPAVALATTNRGPPALKQTNKERRGLPCWGPYQPKHESHNKSLLLQQTVAAARSTSTAVVRGSTPQQLLTVLVVRVFGREVYWTREVY